MDWTRNKITLSKHITETKLYDKNGIIIKRATAGAGNIYLRRASLSSSMAHVHVYHYASNPLCWVPGGIYYEYSSNVYRNGSFITSGNRRVAPAHEAYAKGNNSATYWRIITRRPLVDFICLTVDCGGDPWYSTLPGLSVKGAV